MKKLSLVILISGTGSNMKAIIDACKSDQYPAVVKAVISNVKGAKGLQKANEENIPTYLVDSDGFQSKADFEQALLNVIHDYDPDLICLAGFMKVLSAGFIKSYPNRIINIHPSLLPKYKGLNTYQRALDNGDEQSGCTVHFVVPEVDAGQVIVQKIVPVLKDDTKDKLAMRILAEEHKAYPEAIEKIANEIAQTG